MFILLLQRLLLSSLASSFSFNPFIMSETAATTTRSLTDVAREAHRGRARKKRLKTIRNAFKTQKNIIQLIMIHWHGVPNFTFLQLLVALCDPVNTPDPAPIWEDQVIFEHVFPLPRAYQAAYWKDAPAQVTWFEWMVHAATALRPGSFSALPDYDPVEVPAAALTPTERLAWLSTVSAQPPQAVSGWADMWVRLLILGAIQFSLRVRRLVFTSNNLMRHHLNALPVAHSEIPAFLETLMHAMTSLKHSKYVNLPEFIRRLECYARNKVDWTPEHIALLRSIEEERGREAKPNVLE